MDDDMAKFEILVPELPSEEEMVERARAWFEQAGHTLYDRWPDHYQQISTPTKLVEVDAVASRSFWGDDTRLGSNPYAIALAATLEREIGWTVWFLRLNSRSPKDAPWPFDDLPLAVGGRQAVQMVASSERCLTDIMHFSRLPDVKCYACLREYDHDIRYGDEFRAFVKGGDLIAVSHYDYLGPKRAPPRDDGRHLRGVIDTFFSDHIRPDLPTKDLVFDVAVNDGRTKLIEINPYGLSDPCFFGSYEAVESASGPIQWSPAGEGGG